MRMLEAGCSRGHVSGPANEHAKAARAASDDGDVALVQSWVLASVVRVHDVSARLPAARFGEPLRELRRELKWQTRQAIAHRHRARQRGSVFVEHIPSQARALQVGQYGVSQR